MGDETLPRRALGDRQRLFGAIDAALQDGRTEVVEATASLPQQVALMSAAGSNVRNNIQAMVTQKTEVAQAAQFVFERYRRTSGWLRYRYWGAMAILLCYRAALWVARAWQRFWRPVVAVALFAVVSWAGWTYGPSTWAFVQNAAGEIIGRFGERPADGTPPAEQPAVPNG